MGKLGFLLNGILLSGVITVMFLGSEGVAAPLVDPALRTADGGEAPTDVSSLEARVATSPDSANVAELASVYLERNQPGLAQSLVDQMPDDGEPGLTLVRSRVALAQGDIEEAVTFARAGLSVCESSTTRCPNWLYVKTLHHNSVLDAMKAAGVNDPAAEPERAEAVLASSIREVRLVADR